MEMNNESIKSNNTILIRTCQNPTIQKSIHKMSIPGFGPFLLLLHETHLSLYNYDLIEKTNNKDKDVQLRLIEEWGLFDQIWELTKWFTNNTISFFLLGGKEGIVMAQLELIKTGAITDWNWNYFRKIKIDEPVNSPKPIGRRIRVEENGRSFLTLTSLNHFSLFTLISNEYSENENFLKHFDMKKVKDLAFRNATLDVNGVIWNLDYLKLDENSKDKLSVVLIAFDDIDKSANLILYEFYSLNSLDTNNCLFVSEDGDTNVHISKLPLGDMSKSGEGLPLHIIPLKQPSECLLIITETQILYIRCEDIICGQVNFPRLDLPSINQVKPLISCYTQILYPPLENPYLYLGSDNGLLFKLVLLNTDKSRISTQLKLSLVGQLDGIYLGSSLIYLETKNGLDLLTFSADMSEGGLIWIDPNAQTEEHVIISPPMKPGFDIERLELDWINKKPSSPKRRAKKDSGPNSKGNGSVKCLKASSNFYNLSLGLDFRFLSKHNNLNFKDKFRPFVGGLEEDLAPNMLIYKQSNPQILSIGGVQPYGKLFQVDYGYEFQVVNQLTSSDKMSDFKLDDEIDQLYLDPQTELFKLLPLNPIIYHVSSIEVGESSFIAIFGVNWFRLLELVIEEYHNDDVDHVKIIDKTKDLNLEIEHVLFCDNYQNYLLQITSFKYIIRDINSNLSHFAEGELSEKYPNISLATVYNEYIILVFGTLELELSLITLNSNNGLNFEWIELTRTKLNYFPSCLKAVSCPIDGSLLLLLGNYDSKLEFYSFNRISSNLNHDTSVSLKFRDETYLSANQILNYEFNGDHFLFIGLNQGSVMAFIWMQSEDGLELNCLGIIKVGLLPVKLITIKHGTTYGVLCISGQLLFITSKSVNWMSKEPKLDTYFEIHPILNQNLNPYTLVSCVKLPDSYEDKLSLLVISEFDNLNSNINEKGSNSPRLRPKNNGNFKNIGSPKRLTQLKEKNDINASHLNIIHVNLKPGRVIKSIQLKGTPKRIEIISRAQVGLLVECEELSNSFTTYIKLIDPRSAKVLAKYKLDDGNQAHCGLLWDRNQEDWVLEGKVQTTYFVGIGNGIKKRGGLIALSIELEFRYGILTRANISLLQKIIVTTGFTSSLVKLKDYLILAAGKSIFLYNVQVSCKDDKSSLEIDNLASYALESRITSLTTNGYDLLATTLLQGLYQFKLISDSVPELKFINSSTCKRFLACVTSLNSNLVVTFDTYMNLVFINLDPHKSELYTSILPGLEIVGSFHLGESVVRLYPSDPLINSNKSLVSRAYGFTTHGRLFFIDEVTHPQADLLHLFQSYLIAHPKTQLILTSIPRINETPKDDTCKFNLLDGELWSWFNSLNDKSKLSLIQEFTTSKEEWDILLEWCNSINE